MNPLIINLVFHIAVSLLPLKFTHKSWSTSTWLHKVYPCQFRTHHGI